MKQSYPVSIERCASYDISAVRDAVIRCMEPLGTIASFIQKGDRVLLKPNLLFGQPPEKAVTTHPAVVEAVAQIALDCGATVYLGDSPPLLSAERTIRKCGISDTVKRLGLKIVEFKHPTRTGWRPQIHTKGVAIPPICSILQDMDLTVNLPKLKTHQQMLVTAAVKNLFGCVIGRRKAYWHFKLQPSADAFAAMLLALYECISPGLTVVDAVYGMEGMGPGNGTPKHIGLMLAGTDALAIDRTINNILKIDPNENFVIRMAQELGFPSANPDFIETYGLSMDEARIDTIQLPEMTPIGFSILHIIKGILKYAAQRIPIKRTNIF